MERAVRVIRRALAGHPVAAFVHDLLDQHVGEPRLAHPRFTRDDESTTLAFACPLPEVRKQRRLFAATHESSAVRCPRGCEACFGGCLAQHTPHGDGRGESLERSFAQALVLEAVAKQLIGARADENRIGLGQRLQASGEIWRLAGDRALSGGTRAEQIANDDDAGYDADACLERAAVGAFQLSQCIDDRQAGADCMLRRIFIGLRIAEIGEHTIAHELRHEAVEPRYRPCADVLEAADVRARIFGVERIR